MPQPAHAPHALDAAAQRGYDLLCDQLELLSINVRKSRVTTGDASWEPGTRTMHLRDDAPIRSHIRDLADLWLSYVFPDHSTRSRAARPDLRVVPH